VPDAPAAPSEAPQAAPDDTPDGTDAASQNRQPHRIRAAATGGSSSKTAPEHDLDDVDRHWKEAVAILAAAYLAQIVPGQIKQLVDKIRQAVADGDAAALAQLNVDSTDGAQLLTTSMNGMANTAAKQAVAEAKKQGVDLDPQTADATLLANTAKTVAALQAAALALSAGSQAARLFSGGDADPEDVASQVEDALNSLSDAALTSKLPGALSAAQNESRIATFLAGPSVDLFASEVNDKNTCKPCQDVDATYIGNSRDENIADEIDSMYPNGGYIGCAGGDRCRGTIIADYIGSSGDPGDGGADLYTSSARTLPFFLVDQHAKPLTANGHNHQKAGVQ
jgi:hypothetical protein